MTALPPVIVLAYPHAGGKRLWSLLNGQPGLACTSGTGILALCDQAAATWRGVEGRQASQLSPLAATATRTLTTTAIITILARQGGAQRWCEFATAPPRAAETFLQLYPRTRVLCLHRSCTDVIRAALQADPWGLSGQEYVPFLNAYPASTAAALTAYWVARTTSLIAFEEAHPDACMRVRYEDIADDPYVGDVRLFLDMDPARAGLTDQETPGEWIPSVGRAYRAPFPADQVPAPLLAQADGLARKLGYESLTPARQGPAGGEVDAAALAR
jgi:hypothetical protein